MVGFVGGLVGGASVNIVIRAVDKFSKTFTSANAGLLKLGGAITAVGVAGAFAVGGLIKMAGQFEQTQIAFTTMLGSAEKADKLLKELADFAAKTPFTIPGIEQNAKMLLAMSIPLEDLLPTLKSLGDIASGLNVPMERLALNFGQVRVQGKLTGRELRDFSVAGVPLIAELAKNLNKAENEIKEMVSAGKIGFKDVEKAFETMTGEGGKFFDLMDAQSKTLLGQISNIQDSFIKIARVMGKVFLPAAKFVAEHLAIIIDWFERHPTIATFAAVLLGVATALALIIGPIIILLALLPAVIAGIGTLSVVSLPLTATFLAIAAAIILWTALTVILWKKWDTFGTKTKILLAILFPLITIPILIIKNWDKLKVAMAIVWNTIVKSTEWGVNKILDKINILIDAYNWIAEKLGRTKISRLKVDFSAALVDIDAMKARIEAEKQVTDEIVEQNKVLTKQEQLAKDLEGFYLNVRTGDIFKTEGGIKSSTFKDIEAFDIASRVKLGQIVPGDIGQYTNATVVNITIDNVNGLDPDEIAEALNDKLKDMII